MSTVTSVREPPVYHQRGRHSFFGDLLSAQMGHEPAARRLLDHQTVDMEARVNPNTTAGTGGEFAPPAWLIDQFSAAAVAGRVLADVVGAQPLPPGRSSIEVPRTSTGALEGVQAGQGEADFAQDEVTADASSKVVTITGEEVYSMQLFELGPMSDVIAYTDLSKNYNKQLDNQLFFGTGTSGQLLGVANVTGRNSDVSGAATTTMATFWPQVGQIAAAIGNNRQLPASAFFAAPRRVAWVGSSVDSSSRPIASPGHSPLPPAYPTMGSTQAWMQWLGRPVWEAGAIPAGANADTVFALRPEDFLLYESDPKFLVAADVTSGTLQVRLRLAHYVAFIPHRYPTSICALTALPQPSNF